jgi:hypothetical protein
LHLLRHFGCFVSAHFTSAIAALGTNYWTRERGDLVSRRRNERVCHATSIHPCRLPDDVTYTSYRKDPIIVGLYLGPRRGRAPLRTRCCPPSTVWQEAARNLESLEVKVYGRIQDGTSTHAQHDHRHIVVMSPNNGDSLSMRIPRSYFVKPRHGNILIRP